MLLACPLKASEQSSLNQLDFETERLLVRRENYDEFQNKWLYTSWPMITLNHVNIGDEVEIIDPDIIPPSLFVGYRKQETPPTTPIVVYALGLAHIMKSSFTKKFPIIKQTLNCLDMWYFEECMETDPNFRGQGYMNELRSYLIKEYIDPFLTTPKLSPDKRLFLGIASYALNASSAHASLKMGFSLCQTRHYDKGCYLVYTSALLRNVVCFPEEYQLISRDIVQALSQTQKKEDTFSDELNEIHHIIAVCFRYQKLNIWRIQDNQLLNFVSLATSNMPKFLFLTIANQLHKLPCFKECAQIIINKVGTDLSSLDTYLDDFSIPEKEVIRAKLQVLLMENLEYNLN